MSNWKELPYGIDFVVEQDLVPQGVKKYKNSKGYAINCPFCAKNGLTPDTHHKYAINVYKNVGHCFRCGAGHGTLSLHQDLAEKPLTIEEAEQDLNNRWNGLPSSVKAKLISLKAEIENEAAKQLYPAPIELRDRVYRRLLNQLTLSSKHYDDLIARGLSDEEIKRLNYKSIPTLGFSSFAYNCFHSLGDYESLKMKLKNNKWGIPGFYNIYSDDPKITYLSNGYFVPIHNEKGLISGMQIRFDNLSDKATQEEKDNYAKYKWFTSNTRENCDGCSASGCENIHYAGDWSQNPKQIILTEGVLKADVAAYLSSLITGGKRQAIIGLTGIYNIDLLAYELAKLKEEGLEKVILAIDMDYQDKPQVALAKNRIIEIIRNSNLNFEEFNWNKQYKGIDDYFLAILKHRESQQK